MARNINKYYRFEQNILEKYDHDYKPPFEVRQYPVVTIDGKVFYNPEAYEKSKSKRLKVREIRQLLGQTGKYHGNVFWKGKKYSVLVDKDSVYQLCVVD